MRCYEEYNSPIGRLTMISDGESLIGLHFDGQKYSDLEKGDRVTKNPPVVFVSVKKWLDEYFGGKAPDFTPKIDFGEASDFRKTVWKILLEIPCGETTTYGAIAKRIEAETKKRVSAQAVGGAVGHNPVAIIVPCHRVIGSRGNLTGYAGGSDKKSRLLKIEGVSL